MTSSRTISDDIYFLGDLLGDVITAQAGIESFDLEEQVRALAKAHRAGDPEAGAELRALISGVSIDEAVLLIRAFTSYFQLINLSEDNERVRRMRRREAEYLSRSPSWLDPRSHPGSQGPRHERRRCRRAAATRRGAPGHDRASNRSTPPHDSGKAGAHLPHAARAGRAEFVTTRSRSHPRPVGRDGRRALEQQRSSRGPNESQR